MEGLTDKAKSRLMARAQELLPAVHGRTKTSLTAAGL